MSKCIDNFSVARLLLLAIDQSLSRLALAPPFRVLPIGQMPLLAKSRHFKAVVGIFPPWLSFVGAGSRQIEQRPAKAQGCFEPYLPLPDQASFC
jgi:hypothetical protein